MNPAQITKTSNQWLIPISVACALLGVLATWAYKIEIANKDSGGGRATLATQIIKSERQFNKEQREEIIDLRNKLNELENASTSKSKMTQVLSDELKSIKVMAGLVDVEGPGITVLLQDSPHPPATAPELRERYIIHDNDILQVINELHASGAEVIAVNGHRATSLSSVRCVGPVVHFDGIPLSSPFRIEAIGEPETLRSAMNLNGGVLSNIRQLDPKMVDVILEPHLKIAAYGGTTKIQYAKPIEKPKQ
jgi:uncharacterized protein YlxW (UPF0749 family)